MTNFKLKPILTGFVLCLCLGLVMSSCGDDDVEGCTDPNAENYNPDATVSSGDCTYARDKFIGDYLGSFICPGALSLISSDSLVFSIQPGLNSSNTDEVIVSLTNLAGGLTFDLPATVSGNELSITAELLGVPVLGFTGDVTGNGTGSLDSTESTITATIAMSVATPLGAFSDSCTLVGTKQ